MMPKITKKQLLASGAYTAFFGFCFVVSAYFTFPYDRVRDLIVSKASSPSMTLAVEELGPHWLTGVSLRGVTLSRPAAAAGEAPSRIEIDQATLSASALSALFGDLSLTFSAEVGEGEVEGSYQSSETSSHIEAEFDELDLGKMGVGDFLGVPLKGKATGPIDVTLSEKPAETEGGVELQIKGLKLGDGKHKVNLPAMPGGFTLETINAGTLDLKVTIREGVATIDKLESKGKDLELSGSGSLSVVSPFSRSRADVMLGAKFLPPYKERNDRTKVIFELMDNTPQIKSATGSDGMMRFKITGPITALHPAPAAAGARRGSKARRARPAE